MYYVLVRKSKVIYHFNYLININIKNLSINLDLNRYLRSKTSQALTVFSKNVTNKAD